MNQNAAFCCAPDDEIRNEVAADCGAGCGGAASCGTSTDQGEPSDTPEQVAPCGSGSEQVDEGAPCGAGPVDGDDDKEELELEELENELADQDAEEV